MLERHLWNMCFCLGFICPSVEVLTSVASGFVCKSENGDTAERKLSFLYVYNGKLGATFPHKDWTGFTIWSIIYFSLHAKHPQRQHSGNPRTSIGLTCTLNSKKKKKKQLTKMQPQTWNQSFSIIFWKESTPIRTSGGRGNEKQVRCIRHTR